MDESRWQDVRIATYLFQLFLLGVLSLTDVREEAQAVPLDRKIEYRLMCRCVAALYGIDLSDLDDLDDLDDLAVAA